MTSSSAPSTTSRAGRAASAVPGRRRARWRRAVSGLLMAGSLAVTTACGVAVDEGSSASAGTSATSGTSGYGSSGASGTSGSSGSSGSSDGSGSTGTRLGQGSTTVTHALSQGS